MASTNQPLIDSLVARIEAARDAYYNNSPIMSDAIYDALEDELRKLAPNHAVLTTIGAAPGAAGWPKVKHTIPMSSLNKAQPDPVPVVDALGHFTHEAADMEAWFKLCKTDAEMIHMDKLDGGSIDLVYENRKLVQGITRGDGEIGQDITRNVLLMKGAVKMLPAVLPDGTPTPAYCAVRGEVIITHTDFATHFKGESNPRNCANGTMLRQSDPAKCAYLTILSYNLMPNGVSMAEKSLELESLATMGFGVPKWGLIKNLKELYKVYGAYVGGIRKGIGYEIDGIVVEFNDSQIRENLGDLNGKPKGSIAYKFPHEQKPTTLRDVRWQVGNSGRITPVAEFDTVNLAGANVKQASLHNISYMLELAKGPDGTGTSLCRGDTIIVSRRNDVIPYVEAVLSAAPGAAPMFLTPTNCPSCKGTLQRDGEYLVCRNLDCEAQAAGSLKRWIAKIGVLHFGESLIEALLEAEFVEDIADLYGLDPFKVADLEIGGRRVGGTADKAINNLNAKKSLSLATFVGSLGIPLIGRSMAQTIVDAGFDSLSKMMKAKISEIEVIPGVGQTKAEAFVIGFSAKATLIGKLIGEAGIQIQQVQGALLGTSFVFTGFRSSELKDALEAAGATVKDSAGKSTSFLVALDKNGSSGKLVAARKNGTTVIDADDAWAMVGGKV